MADNGLQLLEPGQDIKPKITEVVVPELIKRLYGLTVTEIKPLVSYDDKNFRIKVEKTIGNPNIKSVNEAGYVFKIVNSLDSKKAGLILGQHKMMTFLESRGFNTPIPIPNLNGVTFQTECLPIGEDRKDSEPQKEHIVRMLTFMPGRTLYEVPYTSDLFFECGEYLARMQDALKEIKDECLEKRRFIWMLACTPDLSKFSHVITDSSRKTLVDDVLEAFNSRVVTQMDSLEKGLIHGDFNEQNILVSAPDSSKPEKYHVKGVIDFGDVHHGPYIFELALCIAYMMIEVTCMPPLEAGGHVIAGYLQQRTLKEEEWQILQDCVCARFAQSLVLGAYTHSQDPGNSYVLTTATKGWKILADIWNTPREQVIAKWKNIVDGYHRK